MDENISCPIKSIEEVQNDLMDNMYIANVLNRIRELQSPSPVDRTRWLWELLQNAQDSIKPNEKVTAKVKVYKDNSVTFEHTGGIFTGKAMCGLLYKYSEGKGNEESTGRFGTGFMTTLTLSEIIEVETNIYEDTEKTKVSGFFVILYRNGTEKEELKQGLRDMRKSFKKCEPFTDFTTRFKYNNSNEIAIDLGHKSFLNCGAQTMLFATKVQNFTFDFIGKISSIERGNSEQIDDYLSIHSFTVNNETNNYERKFILITIKEINEILSKKFKKERNLRLQIAIEFTENKLVSHKDKTCLYCTFPFVGSENHQLPFLMNCPDFEPDTERQSLLLEGDDYVIKNDAKLINSPLINKTILGKSLDLFKQLLGYLIDHQFQNLHYLTNGLIHFDNIKHMNNEWYSENFIVPIRNILEESPIIKTIDDQMTLLKDAYFPIYNEKADDKQRRMYHNLVCHRYPNKTVTFEESENWEHRTWDKLHLINIEDLIKDEETLSQDKEKSNTSIEEKEWEYLNLLLEYTKQYELNLLIDHPIIPDMNEKRHPYSEDFFECKEIHEDMLNILDSINHPWKSKHMHNKINKIEIPKHFMNDAIQSCIETIDNNLELSYIVSSYLPKDNSRRKNIFDFINEILNHHIEEHYLQYEIDSKLWMNSDSYLIKQFIDTVVKYKQEEVRSRFELIHRFISFLNEQEIEKKYLNEYSIVPNQNYILCKLSSLRDNSNIPLEFKQIAKNCFDIDINNEELNSELTDIKCSEKSTIQCYQQSINDKFSILKDNKREAAILLTHVLPKDQKSNTYEIQSKLLNLLKPFENKNQVTNTIIIDYGEENLWKQSNEYVKNKIIKEQICKHKKLEELTSNFKFESDDATIEYLNKCYELVTHGKIMPNQYGDLCNINELEDGRNVDENFLDLLKFTDPKNNDYRLKLSDKRIDYGKLKRFDIVSFYKKAETELESTLKDEKKKADPKFKEILKKMNKFEDNNFLSFFSKDQNSTARRNLIYRIYVANVKNFLRNLEVNNADNMNKRRWGFELIQNARDTVVNIPGRKVSIEFIYSPHEYLIFRHNGDDFTIDTLIGLLFKISEGKEYSQKAVGRFGTGFMSTHILNRKIELKGNIAHEGKKTGFRVMIDRTGKGSNELIEHADLMTNSFDPLENPIEYTEFKYLIESDCVNDIVKMGLECIDQNLPHTLISCPEIEHVKVKYDQNEKIYKYNVNSCNDSKIINVNDGSESGRCFLIASIDNSNKILSQFKEKESNLSITAALEIKDKSLSHFESESLFCLFPLIGSKDNLEFPISINCQSFEPTTERGSIYLNKPENKNVSASSVNKEILMQSVDLFKNIVDQCVELNVNKLFILTNGLLLKNIKDSDKDFDIDWYKCSFISNMRNILEESPIVKTIDDQMTLLKDAYFPIYNEKADDKQRRMYHNLVCHRYPNKTVTFEESENWEHRTWDKLHLINIEDLIKDEEILSQDKEKSNTSIEEKEWEYLNLLLEYTKQYELNLLIDHPIIPDMNEKRHPYSEDFFECKEIHEDMLNILDSINHPWKSKHMHNKINKIEIHKHFMNDAIQSCIETIDNNLELSYIVSSYLPKDNSRRKNIFDFINEILNHHIEEHYLQYEIDSKLWMNSDSYLIKQFIDTVVKYKQDEVRQQFELIHRFISFLNEQEIEKKYLNEYSIVPNQNYILCKLSSLRDNSNIPEKFKNGILTYLKIDIDDDELNHQITDIQCTKNSEISIYQEKINNMILEIDQKVEVSAFLLHFRPKKEEEDKYEKIDQIQQLYQKFLSDDEKQYISDNKLTISIDDIIQTDLSSSVLWNNASKFILAKLLNTINNFSLFKEFQDCYHLDEENAVSLLNRCYIYEPNINIPILTGQMVKYESRYKSDGIDKKIIKFITVVNENDSILSELAWSGINHPKLIQYDSSNIVLKIQRTTRKICQDETLREDPYIKSLINEINLNVMDNIFSYNDLSDVDKEKLSIFSKLFVSNLGPRLRELENPSDNIKERWPWELIQNAKDTIASEPDKKVNIKFKYDKNHLIFEHDGNDFTLKQYLAMVYKFSEDKHDQKGSTGRFGTGFLTTHIISTEVILRGNLLKNNELKGFQVTLDRTGHKDYELEESMRRTEESKKMFDQTFDCTSFEYKYDDEEHIDRVKKGMKNLMKNLPLVLLFSRNINSVVIENLDKNEKHEFSLESNNSQIINDVKIIKNDNDIKIRRFIYFHTEKESQYIDNLYYRPDKQIEVNAVLEIDPDNKIISRGNAESLYCVFPLIGSKITLPFIIDSPDFETTTERDSIYLKNSSEDKSTVDKINYEILGIGLELYQKIIEYCIQNKISCLYYLANGLNHNIAKSEHIDPKVFSDSFLSKAKNILSSHPVFLTTNGYKCINEATLINYSFPTKEETDEAKRKKFKDDFYSLFSRIYKNPISFQESLHWYSLLWTELNAIKHIDLLKKISQFESIPNIQFANKIIYPDESSQIQFINDTIDFVLEFDKVQLKEINLIPNQNQQFCKDNSELYFANEVIEEAVRLIHRLGGEWKQNHVFRGIPEKNYLPVHKIQDAESMIRKLVNKENSTIMMEYIIPDNQERIKMHDYSHKILFTPKKAFELPGYSNDIWSVCDRYIIISFILKIQELKYITYPIESVEFLNDIISFCIEKGLKVNNLKKCSIFPNQENIFMPFDSVFKDEIKHSEIKDAMHNYCQINIREKLLHSDFTIDLGFKSKYLKDYSYGIEQFYLDFPENNRNYHRNYYSFLPTYTYSKEKFKFSIILLKYICDDMDIQQNQKNLIKAYNTLFNKKLEEIELKSSMIESTFRYVSRSVCAYINNEFANRTIDNFVSYTKKELKDIIICLNIVYKFSKDNVYVPNQQKIFCKYSDLKIISDEDDLEDIIDFQVSLSKIIKPQDSLTNILVMDGIKCPSIISVLDIEKASNMIDSLIIEKYSSIIKSGNTELKCILNNLIKFIKERDYWKYFPHLKQYLNSLIADFIVSEEDRDLIVQINKLPTKSYKKLMNFMHEVLNMDVTEDTGDFLLEVAKLPKSSYKKIMDLIPYLANGDISEDEMIEIIGKIFGLQIQKTYGSNNIQNFYFNYVDNRRYYYYDNRRYYQVRYRSSYYFNEYDGQYFYSRSSQLSSGSYTPSGGSYMPSGGSYMPSGGSYYSSSGSSMDGNRIIGYKGEAYAYEKLKRAGFDVEWPNLSNKDEPFKVTFNGKTYNIKESYLHYDLKATKDGHVFYYEVKTTVFSTGNGFAISPSQVNFMLHYHPNASKRLLFVFNIRSSNPTDLQLELVDDRLMLKYLGES